MIDFALKMMEFVSKMLISIQLSRDQAAGRQSLMSGYLGAIK